MSVSPFHFPYHEKNLSVKERHSGFVKKSLPHLSGKSRCEIPVGFSTFSASRLPPRVGCKHLGCRASSGLFPQPLLIRIVLLIFLFAFANNIIYYLERLSTSSCFFAKIVYTLYRLLRWGFSRDRSTLERIIIKLYIWKTKQDSR